jgi:hypothetical protein
MDLQVSGQDCEHDGEERIFMKKRTTAKGSRAKSSNRIGRAKKLPALKTTRATGNTIGWK